MSPPQRIDATVIFVLRCSVTSILAVFLAATSVAAQICAYVVNACGEDSICAADSAGTISVINTDDNRVHRTIGISGIGEDVGFDSSRQQIFVAQITVPGTVAVVDVATLSLASVIEVERTGVRAVAFAAEFNKVLVGPDFGLGQGDARPRVVAVDAVSLAVEAVSDPMGNIFDIVLTEDDSLAFLAVSSSNPQFQGIVEMDVATLGVRRSIPVPGPGGRLLGLGLQPGGRTLFAGRDLSSLVLRFDTETGLWADLPIDIQAQPVSFVFSKDGSRAYVTASCSSERWPLCNDSGNGFVRTIDTATLSLVGPGIEVGRLPGAPALTPDGARLYVPNALSHTISVIDLATESIIATIPVDHYPRAVAIEAINDGCAPRVTAPSATPAETPPASASPARTPMMTPTSIAIVSLTPTRTNTSTRTATPATMTSPTTKPCIGACGGSAAVTVDAIVRMVSIALGSRSVGDCLLGDANRDGRITVEEILVAVSNALYGCGVPRPTKPA